MRILQRLARDLGFVPMVSLGLIAASAAAFGLVVKPLEERAQRLGRELEQAARAGSAARPAKRAEPRAQRVAAFYSFFDRPEHLDTWLAKLYGIAEANGMDLRSGEYRQIESKYGIERYQVSVPVAGTYSQVRAFAGIALAEMPVASLDRVSFRRKAVNDSRIDTELVFSVHLAKR